MHRLQTAHSFWTHEPSVFPTEYPEFGVHGRGGKLYDWYGLGQPLLLLPVDIIGTYLEKLPIFDDYAGTDPTIRNIFVTYTINTLINVLTALVCLRLLASLGFNVVQSVAGVLALLFCTTHLHYTQNMMENNYILLLTLIGFNLSVRMAAHWGQARSADRLRGAGHESDYPAHHRPRLNRCRSFSADGSLVEAAGKTNSGAASSFMRKPPSNLFLLHAHRPRLPVLPLRHLDRHLCPLFHARTSPARPHPACKIPLETPFHVGFLAPSSRRRSPFFCSIR